MKKPGLPEGYRAAVLLNTQRLYFGEELLAEYDTYFPATGLTLFGGGGFLGEVYMDVEHAAAIVAFLQGVR